MIYENRLARARAAMRSQGIDLLLLTPSTDLFYLTGMRGHLFERLACCLISQEDVHFISPVFELGNLKQATKSLLTCHGWQDGEDPFALAGGLLAQYQGSATIDMGRGAIVIGLAAVIIGEVLLDKVFRNFALKLLSAVIGAIIYYVVITVVLRLGLESTDLKLLTALVVAVFLAVPYWKGRYFTKPVRKEGAPHA